MNHDDSNQGRKCPVFFESAEDLKSAWWTAVTLAATVGAIVIGLWGKL